MCGDEDSWAHSLIRCTMARCVWALCDPELVEHLIFMAEPDAKAWIFSITVTLWAIWSARRKLIHEDEHQSPLATHLFIDRYLSDLQFAMPTHAISNTHMASAWPQA